MIRETHPQLLQQLLKWVTKARGACQACVFFSSLSVTTLAHTEGGLSGWPWKVPRQLPQGSSSPLCYPPVPPTASSAGLPFPPALSLTLGIQMLKEIPPLGLVPRDGAKSITHEVPTPPGLWRIQQLGAETPTLCQPSSTRTASL